MTVPLQLDRQNVKLIKTMKRSQTLRHIHIITNYVEQIGNESAIEHLKNSFSDSNVSISFKENIQDPNELVWMDMY